MSIQTIPGNVTSPGSKGRNNINNSIRGIARLICVDEKAGRFAKARIKVRRYVASGMTHTNGAEARFVLMWFVTASISAEGRNAAATQYNLVHAEGRTVSSKRSSSASLNLRSDFLQIQTAVTPTITVSMM